MMRKRTHIVLTFLIGAEKVNFRHPKTILLQKKKNHRPPEVASKTQSTVRKEAQRTTSSEHIDCQYQLESLRERKTIVNGISNKENLRSTVWSSTKILVSSLAGREGTQLRFREACSSFGQNPVCLGNKVNKVNKVRVTGGVSFAKVESAVF